MLTANHARRFARNPVRGLKGLFRRAERARALRRFIAHNHRAWSSWKVASPEPVVLADLYDVHETLISYSYFLNVLARRFGAGIRSFGPEAPRASIAALFRSFNVAAHTQVVPSAGQLAEARALLRGLKSTLKTKSDLFRLEVLGLHIGIDIYESYLRYGKSTVDMQDPVVWATIERGLSVAIFWRDYFSVHRVAAVVVSHDCYVELNILCKVAYRAGVPVYLPNVRGITFAQEPHATCSYFPRLREMFGRLDSDEQRRALDLARQQLQRRFSGELRVDMPYQLASAFGPVDSAVRVVKPSSRTKVLICTHCFYDNPHAYGGLLFTDFYEWLRFVAGVARRTDYDWYLKTHPDALPGTDETIQEVLESGGGGNGITVLPREVSHHQLVAEGIDFVLTCYGSVGHEYPALGVPVINAGYNPRVAYDFNLHPANLDEYERLLLGLPALSVNIDRDQVYEFYYMNHRYTLADDLVFPSYTRMLEELPASARNTALIYGYFLDTLTETRHAQIIARMEEFIASGCRHLFSRGPELASGQNSWN